MRRDWLDNALTAMAVTIGLVALGLAGILVALVLGRVTG
jgi:hypothetical protein